MPVLIGAQKCNFPEFEQAGTRLLVLLKYNSKEFANKIPILKIDRIIVKNLL